MVVEEQVDHSVRPRSRLRCTYCSFYEAICEVKKGSERSTAN